MSIIEPIEPTVARAGQVITLELPAAPAPASSRRSRTVYRPHARHRVHGGDPGHLLDPLRRVAPALIDIVWCDMRHILRGDGAPTPWLTWVLGDGALNPDVKLYVRIQVTDLLSPQLAKLQHFSTAARMNIETLWSLEAREKTFETWACLSTQEPDPLESQAVMSIREATRRDARAELLEHCELAHLARHHLAVGTAATFVPGWLLAHDPEGTRSASICDTANIENLTRADIKLAQASH